MKASLIVVVCAALGIGCTADVELEPEALTPPRLEALNTYEASVGEVIEALGSNISTEGTHFLVFDGSFDGSDGVSEPVTLREPVRRVDAGMVEWANFGPNSMPFSPNTPRPGTFYGTITLESEFEVESESGGERESVVLASEPLEIAFEVLPSIIVREFEPITANCAQPAELALGSVPYRMSVEAFGIDPVAFNYVVTTPQVEGTQPRVERHLVTGRFDEIGRRGDFMLPEVPEERSQYALVVHVEALNGNGALVRTSFAIEVHRPIEVYYNGNVQLAQILPAQPVSGCMAGGVNGRDASYNDRQTEYRRRSFNVGWKESWRSAHSVTAGSSETRGSNVTNGVGYGVTEGNSVTWQVGTTIKGALKFGDSVGLSVYGNVSRGETNSRAETTNVDSTEGLSESSTTTNSESVLDETGGSAQEEFTWEVASSESISRDFGGNVIAGRYGVFYRQAVRMVRRGALVTYNQCGAAEVVGEVDFVDWAWAADLALGESCPDFPPTNLPAAQCLIPPCSD